jgi:hypothetical protein
MVKHSKIIYRTLSVYPLYKNFLLRIASIGFSIFCFYHFQENPWVTSIAGTFFFIAFMIIGDDELVVYSNRLRFSSNSILSLFSKQGRYNFCDVSTFSVSGEFGLKMDLISDNAPISLIDPHNTIEIILCNGRVITIYNQIYIDKLKKASQLVNKHIQMNSKQKQASLTYNGR